MPLITGRTRVGANTLVVDPYTGKTIDYVKSANTDEGWLERFLLGENGKPIPMLGSLRTERRYTDYDLIDRQTGVVKYEVRAATF